MSKHEDDTLGKPLRLPCGVTLPNRIAKAAMTEQMADVGNAPTEEIIRLYQRWASSGCGLLITGNVMVDRNALEHARNVVVEDERETDALKRWADASRSGGSEVWMQISHPGRQSPRSVNRRPVAPSEVSVRGLEAIFAKPCALRADQIPPLIARFARTASIARNAGFTGVQIHGAHGYLISEFLSPRTNRRTDEWGGPIENRMRFLLETVRAVRAEVGASFPIGVKLNSSDFQRGGFTEEDSMTVVETLEREGVDLLEISGGNYESPAMVGQVEDTRRQSTREREAFFLEYARKVRTRTAMPLMLTGGFRTALAMRGAIDEGAIDVVGIARPLAVEPDLPARILRGEADSAVGLRVSLGIKLIDDMMQSFYFNQQMQRMGRGLDPDLGRSLIFTLLVGFQTNLLWNPFAPRRASAEAAH